MILTLFLAIAALGVIAVLLGYFTDDEPYLTVGLLFFFLLSIVILTGNLEYQTGDTTLTNFTYDNGTLTAQEATTTLTYSSWDDNTSQKVGWGLAVMSGLGLALSFYNTRKRRMNDEQ